MLFEKIELYTLYLISSIQYKKVNGIYLHLPDIEQQMLFSEHYLFKTTQLSFSICINHTNSRDSGMNHLR